MAGREKVGLAMPVRGEYAGARDRAIQKPQFGSMRVLLGSPALGGRQSEEAAEPGLDDAGRSVERMRQIFPTLAGPLVRSLELSRGSVV
jgi:hypothetical protein